MQRKKVCLVVDLREGDDLIKISHFVTVFSAAGWKTDITLKTYGGESMKLAAKAAKQDYDLILAYGGDGTLNQVVNGVMNAKGQSIVGAIPGGTFNEWAGEIGLPLEPVHAALTTVNSEARKVDLGHVEVQELSFPPTTLNDQQPIQSAKGKKSKKQAKKASKTQDRFLLMAGLGIDAIVLTHTSKSLKHRTGSLAFALATLKELPELHPFPVEIWQTNDAGETTLLWRGQAWEILIANARRYGNTVDVAPQARLDDGKLNLCVITEGNTLETIQQIGSFLLQHQPDNLTAEYFEGAHFVIRAPASIGMHLDGSLVDLEDYLSKSDHDALMHMEERDQVMITYRFDAEPHALQLDVPRTYDGTLFEKSPRGEQPHAALPQQGKESSPQQNTAHFAEMPQQPPEIVSAICKQGPEVTVIGVAPNPEKKDTYIIAGTLKHPRTGDVKLVAVRVKGSTTIIRRSGEHVPPATVQELQEGAAIVAVGKKSKPGVIRATHVVLT